MRWSQQWKDLGKHNPGRRNSKLKSSRISLAILKERKKPEEPEGRNWTCKNLGKNIPVEGTVDVQAVRTGEPTELGGGPKGTTDAEAEERGGWSMRRAGEGGGLE